MHDARYCAHVIVFDYVLHCIYCYRIDIYILHELPSIITIVREFLDSAAAGY